MFCEAFPQSALCMFFVLHSFAVTYAFAIGFSSVDMCGLKHGQKMQAKENG